MNYLEQFIASVKFDYKNILNFKNQTIWKSILYALCLILMSNLIISIYSFSNFLNVSSQLMFLPDDYMITREGATSIGEESLIIELSTLGTVIVFGTDEVISEGEVLQQNLIFIGENSWAIVEALEEIVKSDYRTFPFFDEDIDVLTKDDILLIASEFDSSLTNIEIIYRYMNAFFDIIVHFILISLFGVAALSFKKLYPISFKEGFTIACYGITTPLIARTLINLIGVNMPFLFTFYWMVVGIFVIFIISNMSNKIQNDNT